MTDHSSRTWLAYLTAEVIDQCVALCVSECPACQNALNSPLLHYHEELGLKEKINRYLSYTALDIGYLFDQFTIQFGWFNLNREQYIQFGEIFLSVSTPDAIFYGKYVTPQNDYAIYMNQPVAPGTDEDSGVAEFLKRMNEDTEPNSDLPPILLPPPSPPPSSSPLPLPSESNNSGVKRQPPSEKKPIKTKQRKKNKNC